jgi:hypothetical protein
MIERQNRLAKQRRWFGPRRVRSTVVGAGSPHAAEGIFAVLGAEKGRTALGLYAARRAYRTAFCVRLATGVVSLAVLAWLAFSEEVGIWFDLSLLAFAFCAAAAFYAAYRAFDQSRKAAAHLAFLVADLNVDEQLREAHRVRRKGSGGRPGERPAAWS